MKNYGTKSKILLDQKLITQTIMIKKYMKMKVNSDYDLPLNKTLGLRNMIIVVTAVFHEDNNYYP